MPTDKQRVINEEQTEAALIAMLTEGSQLAFRQIYDMYAARLYAFCLQYSKSRSETDEIVQDAFVWLWRHRTELRQRQSLKALLFISVRHQLINAWRRNARSPVYEDFVAYRDTIASQHTADTDCSYADFMRILRQQMQRLPHTQRRVIEMSRLESMSIDDIAERLQLNRQTVKNNLSMGLKTLRRMLAEQSVFLLFLFYVKIM